MLVAPAFSPERCQIITPVMPATSKDLERVQRQAPLWGDWIEWRVDALAQVQALCTLPADVLIAPSCEKARLEAMPVSAPLPDSLRIELQKCAEVFLQAGLPVLATIRTSGEGGACSLCDEHYASLIDFLCTLEPVCACDVEFLRENSHTVRRVVRSRGRQVVSSQHFFDCTAAGELSSSTLLALLSLLQRDADVAKIALACEDDARCEEIIQTAKQYTHKRHVERSGEVSGQISGQAPGHLSGQVPGSQSEEAPDQLDKPVDAFILIAMGSHGQPTRVKAAEMGCCATFAALSVDGEAFSSAPGQIDVQTMRRLLH